MQDVQGIGRVELHLRTGAVDRVTEPVTAENLAGVWIEYATVNISMPHSLPRKQLHRMCRSRIRPPVRHPDPLPPENTAFADFEVHQRGGKKLPELFRVNGCTNLVRSVLGKRIELVEVDL